MDIERRIRHLGTVSITYPWMRRYLHFGLVNGSVRHTLALKVSSRVTEKTAARATASHRRSAVGRDKQGR